MNLGFPMKAWRSFSLYTNIVEIFNTKGANKPGNISPLHCMRFFSMVWVISGHAIGMFMDLSINPLDVLEITKDWGTQIIISAYLAVDTFFWQSGLLLSYIWFKKYNQNKRQTMSVFNWVMFYVHRIVRLSPPYYILIAFYTWIVSRKWVANMSPLNHAPMDTSCDSNWWIDFLYLNNFIRYDKQVILTFDYIYLLSICFSATLCLGISPPTCKCTSLLRCFWFRSLSVVCTVSSPLSWSWEFQQQSTSGLLSTTTSLQQTTIESRWIRE